MATTNKASTAPKKTKTVATKAVTKKPVTKTAKATRHQHTTLRRSSEDTPFFTLQITHQTLYWLILAGVVIALAAWVMHLNGKIQDIYNQIETTNAGNSSIIQRKVVAPAE